MPVVEGRAGPEGPPEVHPGQVVQVIVALAEVTAHAPEALEGGQSIAGPGATKGTEPG